MGFEKKVKIIKVFDNITLESAEDDTQAAASRIVVDTYLSNTLNLTMQYTTGAGETSNNAYMYVYGYIGSKSDSMDFPYADTTVQEDSDNWILIGEHAYSSGTATYTASEFKLPGASAATTYHASFSVDICWPKLYFTAKEDGVASNKGTLTSVVLIQ